ncbi:hypothetical protein TNCV_966301 [Trichonephila clavipes]|nr:hypothetical protein TNCV_966301 [Trichonephila clavipes]
MILGAFGWNEIGFLITIKDKKTGNEYLFHLEIVKPLMEDCLPDGDGIYQDDNVTSYRVKTVQTWFNNNPGVFPHLKRPSKSPDISVIENP